MRCYERWQPVSRVLTMCSGSEAGSYLRRIDSWINQFKAQGPSWTCNESQEGEVSLSTVLTWRGVLIDCADKGCPLLLR